VGILVPISTIASLMGKLVCSVKFLCYFCTCVVCFCVNCHELILNIPHRDQASDYLFYSA